MRCLHVATLTALLAVPAGAYTIVLRDGRTFEAASPPVYVDGRAVVTVVGGAKGFFPESQVDRAATEAANRGLIQGSHEWKYNELTWWKDFDYRPPEPPPPSLGSIAPGGHVDDRFDAADVEELKAQEEESAASARSDVDLARDMERVRRTHQRLRAQYERLGEELARIEAKLATLGALEEAPVVAAAAAVTEEAFALVPLDAETLEPVAGAAPVAAAAPAASGRETEMAASDDDLPYEAPPRTYTNDDLEQGYLEE